MRSPRKRRSILALGVVLATAAMLMLPAAAGAVLSGVNGKILFASGRDATDATARLYFKDVIGSQGGGDILGPIAAIGGQQLRHPSWSPDRTKIAFAAGTANCGLSPNTAKCDIYTLDLTTPGATPVNITNSPTFDDDRPAWSPDGTRIAWEQENNVPARFDVVVRDMSTGTITNLTSSVDLRNNQKPAWSPDSQYIYYSFGDPNSVLSDSAIIRRKVADAPLTTPTDVVSFSGNGHWQPSISPDGTHMCFTNQGGGAATADILVVPLNAGLPVAPAVNDFIATTAGVAEYNCTWSPDGTKIAYVEGAFGTGNLVQQSYPKDVSSLRVLADSPQFDGNPDWAPDATPTCPNTTVSVPFDTPTQIPLDCTDRGPAYEQTEVLESIRDNPAKGTVGDVTQGTPATVTYTPNPGFTGPDTFTYIGRDARSFGQFGTVTVNVQPKPLDTTKPDITLLRVRPKKLKRGKASMKLGVTTGRRITFALSEAAAVTLKFEKRTTGRRVGSTCRKTTAANRGKKKCTRYVNAGSRKFSAAKQGANSIRFQGRLSSTKRLALGKYRLTARAKDAAGNSEKVKRRTTFRLVRP